MNTFHSRAETTPNLGPVAQLNRILPWVIGMAVLGLVLARYVPQIHKNEDMRRQLRRKMEEVQQLEAEVSRLRAENFALAKDPRTIERTAREQLSFARPDERVVTFQDAPAAGATVPGNTPAPVPTTRDAARPGGATTPPNALGTTRGPR